MPNEEDEDRMIVVRNMLTREGTFQALGEGTNLWARGKNGCVKERRN